MASTLPYNSQSIAGRATYSWNDRYFAEFNVGYNGSENFMPGRRFGVFPALVWDGLSQMKILGTSTKVYILFEVEIY